MGHWPHPRAGRTVWESKVWVEKYLTLSALQLDEDILDIHEYELVNECIIIVLYINPMWKTND